MRLICILSHIHADLESVEESSTQEHKTTVLLYSSVLHGQLVYQNIYLIIFN
jgi:hypothetical protein